VTAKQKQPDIVSMMVAPTPSGTVFPTTRALARPRTTSNALTRRERKTNFELAYQKLLMEATAEKAVLAAGLSKELSVAAVRCFVEAAQEIWDIKLSAHHPDLEQIITIFCIEQIKMNGACQQEVAAIGTNMLIAEMERSIRQEVEYLPQTFWDWLRGVKRTDED
jgi:hypothetical protein